MLLSSLEDKGENTAKQTAFSIHSVAKYNAVHEKVKCNCTCQESTEQLRLFLELTHVLSCYRKNNKKNEKRTSVDLGTKMDAIGEEERGV